MLVTSLLLAVNLCACGSGSGDDLGTADAGQTGEGAVGEVQTPEEGQTGENTGAEQEDWRSRPLQMVDDAYRTYYEIFVYSFYDSNGDGIGDLQGVIQKLDYLNDGDETTDTDLGVTGIWLMPIMPSDTYHKYDAKDYQDIDPAYGSMADFEELITACHERGINVIIDLAMNHSADDHSWFQEAAAYLRSLPAEGQPDTAECPYVDYYHFSRDNKSGYAQLEGTDWYYEAQFWNEMPDLNLGSAAVRGEFEEIADFWLAKGVDGFRLDAVKEYVTGAAGENIEILTWFNDYVKAAEPEAYLVCECWMDRAGYAQYYASGVDSMFDFAFANKDGIIANVVSGRSAASAYGQALVDGDREYASYQAGYIDAPFYTNHDMGRSAGYYAGENSEAQTKLGNALNLLMSGNAFLYYGEELGMKGAGADENKRAPMYWSKEAAAEGMCDGPPDMDDIAMKFDSLEEQSADQTSVYQYVKDAIRLRNQNPEIARGTVTFYGEASSQNVCVLTKEYQGSSVLLLMNTSSESAEVDWSALSMEQTPQELSVLGELLTGEELPLYGETTVTLPPYSIVLMDGC